MRTMLAGPLLSIVIGLGGMGCGASDVTIDPADLDPRDLLGISPGVAVRWDQDERDHARAVLARADRRVGSTAGQDPSILEAALGWGGDRRAEVLASLAAIDHRLQQDGRDPLLLADLTVAGPTVQVWPVAGQLLSNDSTAADAADAADASTIIIAAEGWQQGEPDGWSELPAGRLDFLAGLARRAGHRPARRPLIVVAAPHEPFAAVLVRPAADEPASAELADAALGPPSRLLVNPVLLAVQPGSPDESEAAAWSSVRVRDEDGLGVRHAARRPARPRTNRASSVPVGDSTRVNPYSFFGSIAECAAFQRERCAGCVATDPCPPTTRDATDGAAECAALAADGERGYYLLCINLALAMSTVAECARDDAVQCPQVVGAGNQISALDVNSEFLDDDACAGALDACLGEIFGSPDQDFPGPGEPPPGPPRDVDISCFECGSSCEFSPSCNLDCSTGNCGSALSCGGCDSGGCSGDSGCDVGGCGGSGSGGSGCGSSSDSSGGGCGSSSDSSGGGCGGDCGGGDCGGGDCGGDCGSGCGGGGGGGDCGSNSCQVSRTRASFSFVLTMGWVLMPLMFFEYRRRRERAVRNQADADAGAAGRQPEPPGGNAE